MVYLLNYKTICLELQDSKKKYTLYRHNYVAPQHKALQQLRTTVDVAIQHLPSTVKKKTLSFAINIKSFQKYM